MDITKCFIILLIPLCVALGGTWRVVTDPPYGLKKRGTQELAFQGIYRIPPDGNPLELLVDDLHRPNGLAFSPDEKMLFITATTSVYRVQLKVKGVSIFSESEKQ
jgi:sugar lactone lactonase YvrE